MISAGAIVVIGFGALFVIVAVLVASMFVRQLVNNHPVGEGPFGKSPIEGPRSSGGLGVR